MSQSKVAAVLGVGPGLGAAIAHRFAQEGFAIALMARNRDGMIDTARVGLSAPEREDHTRLLPEAIAETYWQLSQQDATAWTLELDLRPAVERF